MLPSLANAIGINERQNPAAVHCAIRRLPYRPTSVPQIGIAVTDPIAVPSSASPSEPSPKCSEPFTDAIRDTHVETTSP